MAALVNRAITALADLIEQRDLGAVRYVLDYAGFKTAEQVHTDGRTVIEIEYVKPPAPQFNGHATTPYTNGSNGRLN